MVRAALKRPPIAALLRSRTRRLATKPSTNTRVIAVVAHVDAGKTTLTEEMLNKAGVLRNSGRVDAGSATTDFLVQERERGITIQSAAAHFEWNNTNIVLVDTPGHVDFGFEVDRTLRAVDGVVLVVDAVAGAQARTEAVARAARETFDLPMIAVVNKMDRMGANFYRCVDMIVENLGANPVPIQLPIGAEEDFAGVVDLVANKAIIWDGEEMGAAFNVVDIPADLQDKAAEYREKLLEAAVEQDEEAMEKYFEGEEPSEEKLIELIRKGTISGAFVPVTCGTAFKNKGVQPMLDAVVRYLPSPLDLPPMKGVDVKDPEKELVRNPSDDEPFSGLAFKIMTDPFVGSLTFVRIYSGVLESGSYVQNTVKGKKERVGRLLEMHADNREDVEVAVAGDIVAVAGLKDTTTGDSLTAQDAPVILERMDFPDPVIKIAIEPKTKGDLEKMGTGLQKLAAEDPSFHYSRDEETNQTVIEGMGELHLEILVDRLKREFNVECDVGAPQVNYRESISKPATVKYTHKKQSGGSGQFADVEIKFEPGEPGTGFEFVSEIKGGAVPKEYIPGVTKGLQDMMGAGIMAGFPVVDVKATLFDGSYHEVDSSVLAFQIAARGAFKDGVSKAGPQLLEPMMKVEVVCPEESMGDVIGDLNSRRGIIGELNEKPGGMREVNATVPLSEMFNYVSRLRSVTKGRGNYTMVLDKYDVVPPNIAKEICDEKKVTAA